MGNNITAEWIRMVENSVMSHPSSAYAQERKFMEGVVFTFPGEVWAKGLGHTLPDLGYSQAGSKMKQLTRDYYNEESVNEAKKIIKGRKKQSVTSIGISTLGAKKNNSQGHCIRSITVNYFEDKVTPNKRPRFTIDLLYRSTELLRKFAADLIFLHDIMIPDIIEGNPWGYEAPDEIRFYFSSCFFSGLFIPVFFQFTDPVEFMKELKQKHGDTVFYRRCLFRTKSMLERDFSHYSFRSRRNMQELSQKLFKEGRIDKKRLEKHLPALEV